jgi:plasmid stabilization system protein ParE
VKPLRYHPSVQQDIAEALRYYSENASESIASRFWDKLLAGLAKVQAEPQSHHFDPSGLRRHNLPTFPYHILYQDLEDRVRVQVIRHHARHPSFGAKRHRSK